MIFNESSLEIINIEIIREISANKLEYAKVFIRADTKKTTIKRTYQKVAEFYADASSLLIALYEVLIIIFTYLNNFYAEFIILHS